MDPRFATTRWWAWLVGWAPATILAPPLLARCAALTVIAGVGFATPVGAEPFLFSTVRADGLLGALSQPAGSGLLETETADDFQLTETTAITGATILGLIPLGTPVANIQNVEVEMYRVFPADSDVDRTSGPPTFSTPQVPTRMNSPADVEIDSATRDGSLGTLQFTPSVLRSGFSVQNTVVNDVDLAPAGETGGEGATSGDVVLITVTFTPAILLPAGHYFFRPEVLVSGVPFLYLTAPKPIDPSGTPFTGDLQSWIRDSALKPDWLRVGKDVIGGSPAPAFNQAFSLVGETIADAGTPGDANCHGRSVSALTHQFLDIDAAASALGFSSVSALQDGLGAFCQP